MTITVEGLMKTAQELALVKVMLEAELAKANEKIAELSQQLLDNGWAAAKEWQEGQEKKDLNGVCTE